MRGRVGQKERNHLAGPHSENSDRREILPSGVDGCTQQDHVGARNGAQGSVFKSRDPGNNNPIAKSQDEIEMESDTAALTDNQAHDGRITAERTHEINERHNASVGFESGLQDQCSRAIPSADARRLILRRNQPPTVLTCSEERGETCVRIKSRPAQPIDRSVHGDQRRRPAITDQCVVLDARTHDQFTPRCVAVSLDCTCRRARGAVTGYDVGAAFLHSQQQAIGEGEHDFKGVFLPSGKEVARYRFGRGAGRFSGLRGQYD